MLPCSSFAVKRIPLIMRGVCRAIGSVAAPVSASVEIPMTYPILKSLQPFRSTRSLGLVNTDDIPDELLRLREEACKCIPQREVSQFVAIAVRAARVLEKLPPTHRLYFNPHFMFLRSPSPAEKVFDAIMSKVFNKACDHDQACAMSMESTSSGYGVSGWRGVGKTQLLRLCTVLASLLLPSVIGAYVDAEAYMQRDIPTTTPFVMLRDAFIARGVDVLTKVNNLADIHDVNDIVCVAAQHGLVTMLTVDEVRCVYPHAALWEELHQLATNSATALFVADSSSRLSAIIKSDSDSRSAALTKKWYGVTRASLNDTKLSELVLEAFTSYEQYDAYLQNRITAEQRAKLDIVGMHVLTNGRIRAIMNVMTSMSEYRRYVSPPRIPSPSSFEFRVLNELRKLQDARGWGADSVFRMVSISSDGISRLYTKWQQETLVSPQSVDPVDLYTIIDDMVAKKYIAEVRLVDEKSVDYTFATPQQLFELTQSMPKLFISHAMEDEQLLKELCDAAQYAGVKVTKCEDERAQAAMMQCDLREWMKRQMTFIHSDSRGPRNVCVIVLSEAYLRNLVKASKNNGCVIEAEQACKQLRMMISGDASARSRLVVVRTVPYEDVLKCEPNSLLLQELLSGNRLIPDVRIASDAAALMTRVLGVGGREPRVPVASSLVSL